MTTRDRSGGAGAVLAVAAVLGWVGFWPAGAHADEGATPAPAPADAAARDEAAARVLFAEARRLVAAGKFEEACPKFEDSLRLNAGIGTSFNLADCLEHVGRIASAWARFLDVAAATKVAGQPERERVARERAAALEPRLARLTVNVDSPMVGMVVQRDALVLTPSTFGVAVPIDPGVHAIKVTAPGKRPWSTDVTVPADEPTSISISVPTLEVLPEPPAPLIAASPPLPQPSTRHLSAPVVAVGTVGLVGIAAAAFFGIEFQRDNSEAKGLCQPLECATTAEQTRHQELVTAAEQDRTLAFVSLGIGAAALVTAGYMWWRSAAEGHKQPRAAGLTTRPQLGSHGLGGFAVEW